MADSKKASPTPVRTLAPAPASTGAKAAPKKPMASTAKAAPRPTMRRAPKRKSMNYSTTPFWFGMMLSIGWVAMVAFAMMQSGGTQSFAGLPLSNWAIGISAIISPLAMIWMIAAYLQRAADVQSVTEPLRRQLAMITGESGAAEVRIRRFNQAIKEQLNLLRSTKNLGDGELMEIIERINAHKGDLESFEQHSIHQVKEIQDVIRRSMQHIEQLMEDKFTMLRVLDSKLVQSGEDVAVQSESVREQIASLLEEIETNASLVATSVEKAMIDSKQLSETARSQETSLLSAAETASTTLQELSGKIDTNIAHFLGRTGLAREEAERLATALDAQTRSLDEFSSLLPARISEAESVLRGVADRLYASEQLAREQSTKLSESLETQLTGMQELLDRFSTNVAEIDGSLGERRQDLDSIVERISNASSDLTAKLDNSISDLSAHAESHIDEFRAANDAARRSTDEIAAQLSETAEKYEAATKHLGIVSDENKKQLHEISDEITRQLEQFESLHQASEKAGQEVQVHASAALQNLQEVLDRLLSTRDATQDVGEALTDKLRDAVTNNEQVITRINEAARMSIHALGTATTSLEQKEQDITDQTKTAESALRSTISELQEQAKRAETAMQEQNEALAVLLEDAKGRLDESDKRLQDFADYAAAPVQQVVDQIDASTAQGRESLGRYSNDMQGQLDRLQQFNGRVTDMGTTVSEITAQTLTSIEDLNVRFEAIRKAQDETSKTAIEQFNEMAERLQTEVGTLGAGAIEASTTLQKAAQQIGQQTYKIQTEAQESGEKITSVTTLLQNEAVTMREVLEKQASDINEKLTAAGTQFSELGTDLKERTDTAYALLDRVASHYNEITRAATEDMESRANNLDETATTATGKVESLSEAMAKQLALIAEGAVKINEDATTITNSGSRTVEQIEKLDETFAAAQKTAVDGTQDAVVKMSEAADSFKEHHNNLDDAAQRSISLIKEASGTFEQQAGKMLDTSDLVNESITKLNSATTDFADQTAKVREVMAEHNCMLIAGLKESIGQIDTMNVRLQSAAQSALSDADKASNRYDELSEKASGRIRETSSELSDIANKTEDMLGSLSADITRQVAALNLVGDQITQQHQILTTANENQREQLLDLFGKLGAAHGEASSVAERTITRLDETLHRVENFLGQLSDQSQTALANVVVAGDGFEQQATKLISNAKDAETQAQAAMTITAKLQTKAKELHDALDSETSRTTDMITDLLSHLTSGCGNMKEISAAANTALTDLQMGVSRQTSSLNEEMVKIAERQEEMTKALEDQKLSLSTLVARLTEAQEETAKASEASSTRIINSTSDIARQIESIDARSQTALSSIQEAGKGFVEESANLSASAQGAENQTHQLLESAVQMRTQADTVMNELRSETEKTNATLDRSVSKVASNIETLQGKASEAETSLEQLGQNVSDKTQAISTNLQGISERQVNLASALDVQRDMLADMVSRLSKAQDEAAAAAERSAGRMAESTNQVSDQMQTLSLQTEHALASIRSANAGLADEKTALSEHTQAAEDQIRSMLESTNNMFGQAKDIRAAMSQETAQVIEGVSTVIAQLDKTVTDLQNKGSQVSGAMDKSALDFSNISERASRALTSQIDQMTSISETSKTNMDTVSGKIQENLKLIGDASNLTEEHGNTLASTAEKATSKLVDLISTMAKTDRETRDTLERATTHLTDTRVTLERELKTIADLSQKAVEQVMGAGSTLAIQSDALRANLASSESALTEAAATVREETAQLPNILTRSVSQIETATGDFKTQTSEIADTMLKTTDRCIGATGAIRDTMMDEAKNLEQIADVADQTLSAFNEAMKAQIEAIKSSNTTLTEEQKSMVTAASETIAKLSSSNENLVHIRTDAQKTTEKLAEDFARIEAQAGTTTKRLEVAGNTLAKQVKELSSMTEKAEVQMNGASESFRTQLERVRTGVQTQIEDINRGLGQITTQLDKTGTSLRSAMSDTVKDVEKIATRFDDTSKETANQLADRTARMRAATEEVAKLLGGFGDQIDVLMDRLNTAGSGIKRHEGDLSGHLKTALGNLTEVASKLDSTSAMASSVTDATLSKLDEVSKTIDKQMRSAAEGGQKVTSIVQSVTHTYAGQAQKLNGSVIEAQDQIISMSKAVEEMQQRTDRMRVTLKLQGDDLLDSLEQILQKLSTAGSAMNDAVEGSMQQQAINSLKKVN